MSLVAFAEDIPSRIVSSRPKCIAVLDKEFDVMGRKKVSGRGSRRSAYTEVEEEFDVVGRKEVKVNGQGPRRSAVVGRNKVKVNGQGPR